ncbi:HTH domain-containing protein [Lentzea fradiae]|uniref:HTH domain-containing protein n=1 Tax=Lentzea fradiae TaxID=200378 RepID=A0A1G7XHZ1_9PSEU|nr:HTH domain-containing protein [Lentzea fradiae]SDG83839.1 HTH domain-containing protein [Lentzea fradiae]
MSHRLTRVLTLLELLQSHARLTGTDLAERLGTDVRTVTGYSCASSSGSALGSNFERRPEISAESGRWAPPPVAIPLRTPPHSAFMK